MSQKNAQRVFVTLVLFSFPAFFYGLQTLVVEWVSFLEGKPKILVDTGAPYFFLSSIFWCLWLMQWAGLSKDKVGGVKSSIIRWLRKFGGGVLIVWFVSIIVFAIVHTWFFSGLLADAGYFRCQNITEVSRVAKGASYIYQLKECIN